MKRNAREGHVDRRHLLASGAAALLAPGVRAATALAGLEGLPKTPRMPVVFVGHGSPMNVITDNPWRAQWEALGRSFGSDYPRPSAILCISAHWLTEGWWVTGMARPPTIHDFGGFPQALFDQQYPAPGAPALARGLAAAAGKRRLRPEDKQWGYDHGTWSVLKPMFPRADIPVLQLSLDMARPPHEHLAAGQELRALRERGVLIVGSGNVVHNLRATQRGAAPDQAYDWAAAFDAWAAPLIGNADGRALAAFGSRGEEARLAHPTPDHLLPLLHAVGAVAPGERARQFNLGFQSGSLSMRSVVWG
jgi:4,5-DOPA dioxygenase extradiol